MYSRIVSTLVFAALLAAAAPCRASSEREVTYRYQQVWSSLIRFLRVDQNFPISEKDKKSGYILFNYKTRGRNLSGSVELIPIQKDQRHYLRLSLRIAEMPTYVESMLVEKLLKKLKSEYGPPPRPRVVVAPEDKSVKSSDEKQESNPASENPPEDDDGDEIEGEQPESKRE